MALLDHSQHPPRVPEDFAVDVDTGGAKTRRIIPLHHVYSTTSPCVSASGSSNVMSKKVKARKLTSCQTANPSDPTRPLVLQVYSRRGSKSCSAPVNFYDVMVSRNREWDRKTEDCEISESHKKKRRRVGNGELVKLGVDSSLFEVINVPRLRDCRNHGVVNNNLKRIGATASLQRKKKRDSLDNCGNTLSNPAKSKKWIRLSFGDADPKTFIGLQCKVYWPLDADWYSGRVSGYTAETKRHHVVYDDGDAEDLVLVNEKIKFLVSSEEMDRLNLSCSIRSVDCEDYDYDEMVVLAASLDDCQEIEPGDIVWAKLTGHAMWPAVVVDESLIGNRRGLNRISGRSVSVQFFGTHDFARIKVKHVISFLKGLLSRFHQKCKQPRFIRSLEEAKTYLSEQKLPRRMLQLQNDTDANGCESMSEEEGSMDPDEDCSKELRVPRKNVEAHKTFPYVIGDLKIISVGKIVEDSEFFKAGKYIFPEGYTALRKFPSITDPTSTTLYKMEVLRDAASKDRPLFRVTMANGEQFNGSSPSACWNKIYKRLKRVHNISSDGSSSECGIESSNKSGADMFGLSNPEVVRLVQGYSESKFLSKHSTRKLTHRMDFDVPVGYRPVRVDWKDLDKCNVCHMDEEYENNLFLQCDKCRMMVHARCYGELEPVGGVLWLCNLCRPGASDPPPLCCLCPVIGGAMKPTTDGRWAHLACAIWIPETCLSDVKRMEPIDGISRINKDRWKLLCSICGVAYGACIQCSNNSCRVSYHPLCARAAGLCVELEDEDRLHLLSFDEDEENQCIRLLSFCKRHRQPSNSRSATDDRISRITQRCSDYTPPLNPSGCARSEPYSYFGRRGRKEPEALAAASLKRLFVENQPYLVGGNSHHLLSSSLLSSCAVNGTEVSFDLQKQKAIHLEPPKDIHSVADKYKYMKETFRKRLAFGKSAIHGFGIFAKHPHRAGDMVIEYTGELVRPPVADRREHLIYNSLVGAGTYMFRIDDERVIDATRAGSIAHLINHSCEPNCYSRVISVNGDEHIIIFAKRDIKRWEELTYDYRFFSIDERLPCYCGFPRCRGVVNDTEAEEQVAKLRVPRSELIDWTGE